MNHFESWNFESFYVTLFYLKNPHAKIICAFIKDYTLFGHSEITHLDQDYAFKVPKSACLVQDFAFYRITKNL